MIEQIEMARADFDRAAAIDAASGVIPMLKSRAFENETVGGTMALLWDVWIFSPHWKDHWTDLAKEPSDRFNKVADELIERLAVTKGVIQKIMNDGHSVKSSAS